MPSGRRGSESDLHPASVALAPLVPQRRARAAREPYACRDARARSERDAACEELGASACGMEVSPLCRPDGDARTCALEGRLSSPPLACCISVRAGASQALEHGAMRALESWTMILLGERGAPSYTRCAAWRDQICLDAPQHVDAALFLFLSAISPSAEYLSFTASLLSILMDAACSEASIPRIEIRRLCLSRRGGLG